MNKLRHTFFIVMVLFFSLNAIGQKPIQRHITGKVLDGDNGNALEYATVSLYNSVDSTLLGGVITDVAGSFSLDAPNGKYYLLFQFMGYVDLKKSVEINGASVNIGKIILHPDSALLNEVEVVAERSTMSMSLDKRVFNVGKDVGNTSANAIEVLENVPSVTVDVEGNVSLRGDESVRILIDGKVSGLIGISTQDALRSIQADMIEKIEVVTNPSVRYDAEGTAGIINIVLKKEKRKGFNGSVSVRGGFPIDKEEKFFRDPFPFQTGVGLALNYRLKKFNIFANYNFDYNDNIGSDKKTSYNFTEELPYDPDTHNLSDAINLTEQKTARERNSKNHTVRSGFDYYLTDDDIFSLSAMMRQGDYHNIPIITYHDRDFTTGNETTSQRRENWFNDDPLYEFATDFDKYFGSKDNYLKASARFYRNNSHEWSNINEEDITDPALPLLKKFQTTDKKESDNNLSANVDFAYHLGTSAYEAGFKYNGRRINDNTEITENGAILDDYTYDYDFNQHVAALYAIYGKEYGRFSGQLGLRAEYAYTLTKRHDIVDENEQKNFGLFPSGHINYKLTEKHQMQVSYARRISRPGYWQMSSISSFNDDRNLRIGNPALKPSYTDSYELTYLFYGTDLNASLTGYYRHSTDIARRFTRKEGDVFITQPHNFGISDDYGLELTGNWTIFKWWNLTGSANFFRSVKTGDYQEQHIVNESTNLHGRLATKFTFKNIVNIQLTGHYHGPHDEPLGKHTGDCSMDLAISRDFFKGDATLTLNVRDVFDSRKHIGESWDTTFWRETESRWNTTTINLNFSYRFNQQNASKRHKMMIEDDDMHDHEE